MKIKVEAFLMKKGNRVAKAAIEFEGTDGLLAGFHLVGFTICDDAEKGLFVLFPASIVKKVEGESKPFFFLRPSGEGQIEKLEALILDTYESMTGFNSPRVKS
jgi:hypothetical protein